MQNIANFTSGIAMSDVFPELILTQAHSFRPMGFKNVDSQNPQWMSGSVFLSQGKQNSKMSLPLFSPVMKPGSVVSVYSDIEGKCKRGAKEFSGNKVFIGNGISELSRNEIFTSNGPLK